MPTATERQALAFLAGVALLGGGARFWLQHREGAAAQQQLGASVSGESVEGQLSAIDSTRANKRGKKRAQKPSGTTAHLSESPSGASRGSSRARKKSEPLSIVDVDVATAEELEQLPRIGPALAARIVANRDSLGPFGSLNALGQVRGIGPAMLKLLDPLVSFSARPRTARGK